MSPLDLSPGMEALAGIIFTLSNLLVPSPHASAKHPRGSRGMHHFPMLLQQHNSMFPIPTSPAAIAAVWIHTKPAGICSPNRGHYWSVYSGCKGAFHFWAP